MQKCKKNFIIPDEIAIEDIYDMYYLFDNEDEMIRYVLKTYKLDKELFLKELYMEESMRTEFGKKNYLRRASINDRLNVNELMSGKYILWETY